MVHDYTGRQYIKNFQHVIMKNNYATDVLMSRNIDALNDNGQRLVIIDSDEQQLLTLAHRRF